MECKLTNEYEESAWVDIEYSEDDVLLNDADAVRFVTSLLIISTLSVYLDMSKNHK